MTFILRRSLPVVCLLLGATAAFAQDTASRPTLAEVKAAGALRSNFRAQQTPPRTAQAPRQQLELYRKEIQPLLQTACVACHGPDKQEGNFRVDTLDPDLVRGQDVDWWLELSKVISNSEMPPEGETKLADDDRSKIIQWLSSEIRTASAIRREEQGHSSFRRLARYEYNYALQDLLGLPFDFAHDLPPETASADGFTNSSEVLQMSTVQFEYYRELARAALLKATVRGEQPPRIYYGITMDDARLKGLDAEEVRRRKQQRTDNPPKRPPTTPANRPNYTHFTNLDTGETTRANWRYAGARYAWQPTKTQPEIPPVSADVVIIPAKQRLVVELGNSLPDRGPLRVRIRASRTSDSNGRIPSLRLEFGWQASNDSSASEVISNHDVPISAPADRPRFYEWDIPLSELTRNLMRRVATMGATPSPSEFIRIQNSSISRADIQIDYVEITTPAYDQWPPASHKRIFIDSPHQADETIYAREVLTHFMPRAWRRPVTASEIDQKLALFARFRPQCDDFQQAMLEVLATVLSSPKFLYLARSRQTDNEQAMPPITDFELATRLSMFLWCSTPDDELRTLAANGRLGNPEVLLAQTKRLLADPRSQRLSKHFTRQWLGMQLLDFLAVDKEVYPHFDPYLKEAMQQEPIAFFHEVLQHNHSVVDFLHADYTMANERLAAHYGLPNVYGNHFRKVPLQPENQRGGLLTQAGLLAMNSDGKDSHPLKRGIWMLERLLNDPPPPPPPAVPEIDLADPEIAKLTLKERIQNHRDDPACLSCHARIDPWGIAFENFDAVGSWRTQINNAPVDATSLLFNKQKLDGMDGLKRFLLANRQDQFTRALVHKLATYALGRPLTFADRAEIDRITADLRRQGDGLATLITLLVASELFQET